MRELIETYADEPPPPPPPDEDDHGPLRRPPQDRAAERAVLGAMLLKREAIEDATEFLAGPEFYEPRHEIIWDAIVHRFARGQAVDAIILADDLDGAGNLNRVGGHAYLHELVQSVPVATNAGYYAEIVRDRAAERRLVAAGTRIIQLGYGQGEGGTIRDILARAQLEVDDKVILPAVPGVDEDTGGRFLDFEHLYTAPPTPIPWLIRPILAEGRVTLLYAPGKAGKSLVAMEASCALCTGRTALLEPDPPEPVHVLYVDQEQTPEDWRDRTRDMGYGLDDAAALNERLHVADLQSWAPLDTPAGGMQLLAEVRRTRSRVVILDTISKLVAGEENSNDTQQALYRNTLVLLKREGVAVLMLDHTGKDLERGARGGSAKTDNIDIALRLTIRGNDKDRLTLTPTHVRFRDDATAQPVNLRRTSNPLRHVEEEWHAAEDSVIEFRPTRLMEKISRMVEATPGLSKSEVLDLVSGNAQYKRKALAVLIAEGYVLDARGAHNKATLTEQRPYREASDPAIAEHPEDADEEPG